MAKLTRHSPSADETLRQALDYQRRGWAVLPIQPHGKGARALLGAIARHADEAGALVGKLRRALIPEARA